LKERQLAAVGQPSFPPGLASVKQYPQIHSIRKTHRGDGVRNPGSIRELYLKPFSMF
jgi:hypothetical protein